MYDLAFTFLATAACMAAIAPPAIAGNAATPERIAVLVGANEAAPGRGRLRYSHDDVRSVAAVLSDLGGFPTDNIVALYDPEPMEVLDRLDRELEQLARAGNESMLLFYYSGHADAQNLFPNGRPLPLAEIRTRLEAGGPSVRLGLVDACRGGGWTSVKGFSAAEAFRIDYPMQLSSEGSAFIASSSGLEDAHESETLGGSFFTHHWVAGLRGAGDRDEDGRVTLSESFEYAKEMTIRDTALVADTPQHPSFQYNLRGRRDLPLAQLKQHTTLIALEQSRGPLQLVDLGTGLIVLEVPAGERHLKLAVPPGNYLVRRREGGRTLAREIAVTAGTIAPIQEGHLEVMAMPEPARKGGLPRPVMSTTLPDSFMEIGVALGVTHDPAWSTSWRALQERGIAGRFVWLKGLSDRFQWAVPTLGFAYRFGQPGGMELIPWGGIVSWSVDVSSVESVIFEAKLGAGTDARFWLGPRNSINLGAGLTSQYQKYFGHAGLVVEPETWRLDTTVGYSHIFGDYLSVHPGLRLSQNLTHGDRHEYSKSLDGSATFDRWFVDREIEWTPASLSSRGRNGVLSIGSVQSFGMRSLPLIQLHLGDVWSLDLHANVSFSFVTRKVSESYMAGCTWTWQPPDPPGSPLKNGVAARPTRACGSAVRSMAAWRSCPG